MKTLIALGFSLLVAFGNLSFADEAKTGTITFVNPGKQLVGIDEAAFKVDYKTEIFSGMSDRSLSIATKLEGFQQGDSVMYIPRGAEADSGIVSLRSISVFAP